MEWIDWVILLCSWAMHLNKGPACYLCEAWLGDFPMNADLNFFYSWIVIKDDKMFSLLFKRNPWIKAELNIILEPFCFAWWICDYSKGLNWEDQKLYKQVQKSENIHLWISFFFLFKTWLSWLLSEHRRLLDIICDVWKGQTLLRDQIFYKRVRGTLLNFKVPIFTL